MPPSLRSSSIFSSAPSCTKQICSTAPKSSRSFSTTPQHDQRVTRARREMWNWLSTQGQNFANPLPGSTNYLGAYNKQGRLLRVVEAENKEREARGQREPRRNEAGDNKDKDLPPESQRDRRPFPLNRFFRSERVLSEQIREEIYKQILTHGKSIQQVSAEMKVEMSRVGAVFRLKMIEKEWRRKGKPLATPYAEAVMSMLPQTKSYRDEIPIHEAINDLPVHASTRPQIFYPTSESRHFTRADAAKVFNKNLLAADDRIPHPELVLQHRESAVEGLNEEERLERATRRAEAAEKVAMSKAFRKSQAEAAVVKVQSPRWEFRFTPINVDDAGRDGRGYNGVGWRYGVPLYDRSKGQIKIPTSV